MLGGGTLANRPNPNQPPSSGAPRTLSPPRSCQGRGKAATGSWLTEVFSPPKSGIPGRNCPVITLWGGGGRVRWLGPPFYASTEGKTESRTNSTTVPQLLPPNSGSESPNKGSRHVPKTCGRLRFRKWEPSHFRGICGPTLLPVRPHGLSPLSAPVTLNT